MAQIRSMAYWTSRFHSRIVPSPLPLASVCRTGAERHRIDGDAAAVDQGLAEWPRVRGIGDIPQPERAVVAAAGQRAPVGAERHRVHGGGAAGQGLAERAGVRGIGDIPQPDRAVVVAAGQRAPVGAERHRVRRRRSCRSGAGRAGGGCAGSVTFHSRSVPSRLPVASMCPSGLNATE